MNGRFEHLGFYLLRTPRLPASTIQELNNCRTKEELWEFLRGLWSQREVREAIYLSSKTIFKELDSQLHKDYHPQKNKLLLSAYKYINRMSGRSTPFGLLAGVSVGSVSRKHTKILLSDEFLQTHRVDAIGFHNFLNPVIKDRSFAIFCTYFANNTLWEKYDRYYYLDYSDADRKRSFNWAWVRKNPVLDMVFQRSKHGASIEELTQQLTEIGLDEHRSKEFIFELIDSNLLLSEFEFSTQDDFTSRGWKRLKDILKKSTLPPLNNLVKPDNQVDLKVGTAENRIQEEVICTITNELKELAVLCHSESPTDMIVFCKEFLKRYGDRQVPLLDAINPETGIGYGDKSASINLPGNLLNDFQEGKIEAKGVNLTDFIKLSMDYWQVATDKGRQPELQIRGSDVQHYLKNRTPKEWPLGFYALGNLLLKATEEGQDQYFFNVLASGGVSSIPLMTRFAHIDEGLKSLIANCALKEERQLQNAVLAEIICVPDRNAGNILARPSFYKYEIPILGQSTVAEQYQISLEDLFVSVHNEEVVLWSQRLRKRVFPRLSSAHNFHYSMAIYRFLCDLQAQHGMLNFSWDWGAYSDLSFTPRVTYKHLILARATWNISRSDYLSHIQCKGSTQAIESIKMKYHLPDVIAFSEGDRELILDLKNPVAVDLLASQLKNGDIVLKEYLFDSFRSPVTNKQGETYNNEVIIPFHIQSPKQDQDNFQGSTGATQRLFIPGSEWTFLKIYCSTMYGEELLRERIPLLISELKSNQIIKKWFMIRYYDPEPHIRLRFLLSENFRNIGYARLTELVNTHLGVLIQNELIHNLVYDTYHRELERYGVHRIELCESIFHMDSESVLEIIQTLTSETDYKLRWLAGMKGIDGLLTVFGLEHNEKATLVSVLRDNLTHEFKSYDKLMYKMDVKYREHRSAINDFFSEPVDYTNLQIHRILDCRDRKIARLISDSSTQKLLASAQTQLISSLMHMFVNRLFPFRQREYEMVLYHLLTKYYKSIPYQVTR